MDPMPQTAPGPVKSLARSLALYLFSAALMTIYGGQVCPFITTLPLSYWALQMALAFALAFGLRLVLLGPLLNCTPYGRWVERQWLLEFGLFFILGWALFAYDLWAWGFPWESGLKVVLGCTTLGFFAATDLALERERRVAAEMGRLGADLVLDGSYMPLTLKFMLATGFCAVFAAAIVSLLVARDLGWMSDEVVNPLTALKSIMIEMVFVTAAFLALALNLIVSFSLNLKLFFGRQNRVLAAVAGGDLACHIPVTSDDEFGRMAAGTNLMIAALAAEHAELQRTQDAAILSLASLAETRDLETGGHILRTQGYVRALAQELAARGVYADYLDADTIELLYKCAPLHDVGKVGVPDAILLKPAKLDAEEWAVMQTHTTLGRDALMGAARILGETSFMSLAAEIAYSHHEKWDGSGYPQGLSGEEIPLSGRLMALADVYDALICRRVYKGAFSHAKARGIITEGRGSHFDPALVEAFLHLEGEFQAIAMTYHDDKFKQETG